MRVEATINVGFIAMKSLDIPIPPHPGMMVYDDKDGTWGFEIKTVWINPHTNAIEVDVEHQACDRDFPALQESRQTEILSSLGWTIKGGRKRV